MILQLQKVLHILEEHLAKSARFKTATNHVSHLTIQSIHLIIDLLIIDYSPSWESVVVPQL